MIRYILNSCFLYLLTFSVQATDYYVCSNGSDANDGLNHASAWKTYAKANSIFSSLNGGDSILFCKGGTFVKSGWGNWVNLNSTTANPVTISSYTPPGAASGAENPIIDVTSGGNAFEIDDSSAPGSIEGYVISNLVLRGSQNASWGILIHNNPSFINIADVQIFGFEIGLHLAGSLSQITISRAFIHDNWGHGFLGQSDNLILEDSVFLNNGFGSAVYNHNIYVSGGPTNGAIIRNNLLHQNSIVGGRCMGSSLTVHGAHSNLLIENNVVWEDANATSAGCWGIEVTDGYGAGSGEQFPGLIIRGNTVANTGNMAIGCTACPNATIENNTVVHQVSSFDINAIKVPIHYEQGHIPTSTNVTVQNNVILHDSTSYGVAVNLGDGDGSSFVSSGNQTYYRADSNMIAGCETYNAGDVITVSPGICQSSIPQAMLNAALAKTDVTELPNPSPPPGPNPPAVILITQLDLAWLPVVRPITQVMWLMSSFNTSGIESSYSTEVSKTVN